MKKKILTLTLCVAMLATVAISGTLAYFTDTDKEDNVFTTAKINIELNEQQRDIDENGNKTTTLEEFKDDKVLYPIVGSAQGDSDSIGLPTAENYVDKIITIKNLDDSTNAYVRLYIAIPTALDNVGNAGQNILHFNFGNNFETGNYKKDDYANWGNETPLTQNCNIDGINYNIYYRDYNKVMAKNTETGSAAYVGFYLDDDVDYDNENKYYTINGTEIKYDFTKGVKIPVFAVGVQSAGFDNAAEAVTAAFGENFNPFASTAEGQG